MDTSRVDGVKPPQTPKCKIQDTGLDLVEVEQRVLDLRVFRVLMLWGVRGVAGRCGRALSSRMPCGRAAMVGNWWLLRFSCGFVRAA